MKIYKEIYLMYRYSDFLGEKLIVKYVSDTWYLGWSHLGEDIDEEAMHTCLANPNYELKKIDYKWWEEREKFTPIKNNRLLTILYDIVDNSEIDETTLS